MREASRPRRGLWRRASAAPLPLLLLVLAIWTDVVTLDGTGFHLAARPGDLVGWVLLALGTVLLVLALWAKQRPIRIVGYAFYSLALAFGYLTLQSHEGAQQDGDPGLEQDACLFGNGGSPLQGNRP